MSTGSVDEKHTHKWGFEYVNKQSIFVDPPLECELDIGTPPARSGAKRWYAPIHEFTKGAYFFKQTCDEAAFCVL